ncbi:MAG: hypothetical protein QM679_11990 [Patulibacter sp.]
MALRATTIARIAGLTLATPVLGTGVANAAAAVVDATSDTAAPRGAVGGVTSPARGSLTLAIDAVDDGAGLATATILIDGAAVATLTFAPGCQARDVTSAGSGDQPGRCPSRVTQASLAADLSAQPAGVHHLRVAVADAAGNSADFVDRDLTVAGPDPVYSNTVQLTVGDPSLRQTTQSATQTTSSATTATACVKPRLSMWLDQRPLRLSHSVPVLRWGARYRFRGRLTCLINGVRRGAPRGTPVGLSYRVKRRSHAVTGIATAPRGRIMVILAYRSSRTLTFRYRAANASSQVRIPIVISQAGRR